MMLKLFFCLASLLFALILLFAVALVLTLARVWIFTRAPTDKSGAPGWSQLVPRRRTRAASPPTSSLPASSVPASSLPASSLPLALVPLPPLPPRPFRRRPPLVPQPPWRKRRRLVLPPRILLHRRPRGNVGGAGVLRVHLRTSQCETEVLGCPGPHFPTSRKLAQQFARFPINVFHRLLVVPKGPGS